MQAYIDGDVLYIETVGPIATLDGWGRFDVVYQVPANAEELHTADGAVSEVLGRVRHALSSVKMSATARREVERALDDLEPGES